MCYVEYDETWAVVIIHDHDEEIMCPEFAELYEQALEMEQDL